MPQAIVYEVRYSQNGCNPKHGPTLVTCWNKERADSYVNGKSDHVVVETIIDEVLAYEVAE